jgi:hypothetical protein
MRAWLEGRFEDADSMAEQAMHEALAEGGDPEQVTLLIGGQLMAQRIFRAGVSEIIPAIREMADSNQGHMTIRCFLPLALLEVDDVDSARVELESIAANIPELRRDATFLHSVWALSMSCADVGDPLIAATLYGLLLPFSRRWISTTASICFGPVTLALGGLATVMGRFDEAERWLCQALADLTGLPPLSAAANVQYATMLARRGGPGDPEQAAGLVDGIVSTATALGMETVVRRAEAVLSRDSPR